MKKSKSILYLILFVVVIVGCSIGYYYITNNMNYFSTDNAKVTAKLYTITPLTSGKLIEWNVATGDLVKKDEILGRQEVLPYVTSPINGIIVKSDVVLNQTVSPQNQLAVVADTSNLYIGVNIEETDIFKIAEGQSVEVKIDSYKNKVFKGVVKEIENTTQTFFSGTQSFSTSGSYTKVTQLIPVKVYIDNTTDNLPLTLGMNATVKIKIK